MANANPIAIQISSELRFLAREFRKIYRNCKDLRAKAIAADWQTIFPNTNDVIGDASDGVNVTPVTNQDVRAFAQFISDFITDAEALGNAKINNIAKMQIRD